MLAIVGPIVVFAFIFLVTALGTTYGKMANGLGAAGFSLVFSIPIFLAAIPAIGTGVSNAEGVRYTHTVEGELEARVIGNNGEIEFSYINDHGERVTFNTDSDYFSLVRGDFDEVRINHVCDETPDLLAPYTIGNCYEEMFVPKDYVLELN